MRKCSILRVIELDQIQTYNPTQFSVPRYWYFMILLCLITTSIVTLWPGQLSRTECKHQENNKERLSDRSNCNQSKFFSFFLLFMIYFCDLFINIREMYWEKIFQISLPKNAKTVEKVSIRFHGDRVSSLEGLDWKIVLFKICSKFIFASGWGARQRCLGWGCSHSWQEELARRICPESPRREGCSRSPALCCSGGRKVERASSSPSWLTRCQARQTVVRQ